MTESLLKSGISVDFLENEKSGTDFDLSTKSTGCKGKLRSTHGVTGSSLGIHTNSFSSKKNGLEIRDNIKLCIISKYEVSKALSGEFGVICRDCRVASKWDHGILRMVCPRCGQIVSKSRTNRSATCGLVPVGDKVVLRAYAKNAERYKASYVGVMRCGSGWRCPACAQSIQAKDAQTLQRCNLGYRSGSSNREVYLVTLTVPHKQNDSLKIMRTVIARAYARMTQGTNVYAWRELYGVQSTVRRLEVTCGPFGFHPHIHVMVYCSHKLSKQGLDDFKKWYVDHWGDAVKSVGWDRPSRIYGVHITYADKEGQYLAKMGLMEVAGGIDKNCRCVKCGTHVESHWVDGKRRCVNCGGEVNRTPWQVLDDWSAYKSERDKKIWRDYYIDILGARRLNWSRFVKGGGINLRKEYCVDDPQQELKLKLKDDIEIDRELWRKLGTKGRFEVWSAYERGDDDRIHELLPHTAYKEVEFKGDDERPDYRTSLNREEKKELRDAIEGEPYRASKKYVPLLYSKED